jgi:uracil phosphoribosyltransferase
MGELRLTELSTHPLVAHKLTLLRDKDTNKKACRELVDELATFLLVEATRDLELGLRCVQTPLSSVFGATLKYTDQIIFPIWRAGHGMLGAALTMMPTAVIGAIGMYRNEETHEPTPYFFKPERIEPRHRDVFVLDPMLATGGSGSAAVTEIKAAAEHELDIRFLSIFAAPEGVARLSREHPDVKIYVCTVDEKLNEQAYIVPGMGDAGDRLFGTR